VDFAAHFDLTLTLIVLAIACACKVLGCGWGARLAGLPRRESWAIGFGMNARGAMEIILGLLALQYGLIAEPLFVALVIMALVTSIISGPMMQKLLLRRTPRRAADFLSAKTFLSPLAAGDRQAAIRELSRAAAAVSGLDVVAIEHEVMARERQMPTGLGLGLAVPHARLADLASPIVCVGLSRLGVDFHAPDQHPAQLIFLLLTPREDDGAQLEVLADIAATFGDVGARQRALSVATFNEFLAVMRTEKPADTRE
jgi:mannitol/fructose-specific phosphotransferase system IIA component (Ntr-type)